MCSHQQLPAFQLQGGAKNEAHIFRKAASLDALSCYPKNGYMYGEGWGIECRGLATGPLLLRETWPTSRQRSGRHVCCTSLPSLNCWLGCNSWNCWFQYLAQLASCSGKPCFEAMAVHPRIDGAVRSMMAFRLPKVPGVRNRVVSRVFKRPL